MAVTERDEVSGQITTGHEWNGIKELNTPVPRLLWAFLICATTFSITWTVLMPSWPGIDGYFRGLLGKNQREVVALAVAEGVNERAVWTQQIENGDMASILADPALMKVVRESGRTLFGDNCAACHGTSATGNPGYPNIAEAPMMWGGDPDTILETIRVGINSNHDETRYAQMLAFGRDKMLEREDIDRVVTYVQSLSDQAADFDVETLAAGEELFVANCAACHGEDAKGLVESGAPNLTDAFWIYGGDRQTIRQSVYNGRQGHMPSWEGRLSPVDIKLLAAYVSDMRMSGQ